MSCKRKYGSGSIEQLPSGKFRARKRIGGCRVSYGTRVTPEDAEQALQHRRPKQRDVSERCTDAIAKVRARAAKLVAQSGCDMLRATALVVRDITESRNASRLLKKIAGMELAARCLNESADVYLVQAGNSGRIKIGRSRNIEKRLRSLQTSNSAALRVLMVAPGGATLEKGLHEQFAHDRVNGEWFRNSRRIREFVETFDV